MSTQTGKSPSHPMVPLGMFRRENPKCKKKKKKTQSNIYDYSKTIVQTMTAVQLHPVHPQTEQ